MKSGLRDTAGTCCRKEVSIPVLAQCPSVRAPSDASHPSQSVPIRVEHQKAAHALRGVVSVEPARLTELVERIRRLDGIADRVVSE
jgi:hypothetical protein